MPMRIIRGVREGKRAQFLLTVSVGWGALGSSYIWGPQTQSRDAAFGWIPFMESHILAWIWIIGSILGFVATLTAQRWPKVETAAFSALVLPPVIWVIVFFSAWVLGHHPYGWISATMYSIYAGMVILVSSWPDPVRVIHAPPKGDDDESEPT